MADDTLDNLRAAMAKAERVRGAGRIRAMAKVRAAAQEVEDRELVSILEVVSAYKVAGWLGITPPAVYARAKHARKRLGHADAPR